MIGVRRAVSGRIGHRCAASHRGREASTATIVAVPFEAVPSDYEAVGDRVCAEHAVVAEGYGFEVSWDGWLSRPARFVAWLVSHTTGR